MGLERAKNATLITDKEVTSHFGPTFCKGEARNSLYQVLLDKVELRLFCFSYFCLGIVYSQLNSATHNSAFYSLFLATSAVTQFLTRNGNL